ncbi:DUF2797 domain-containing protein [Streptomyces sp. TRM66268-LWL]|uniref:DUF2797 domain-containing protein n=2 Tax=Streptomyces polyasparticus TaxID=2767826 RepID=A0ABR7SI62_9ACTN|nr:DUF2797 domain-containing protein [Streptomyces polyasparticus]
MAWWCTGVRWSGGAPALGWFGDGRGERESPLAYGQQLGFVARGGRRCLGVRRGRRRTACPTGAAVPARASRAQCEECARIDRSYSVAADTMADDPRPYAVYLAYFGPGLVKIGITADERGSARLLEQGAVAFTWLGRGPLMAARRVEELVGVALGVPDRIPYTQKRVVRGVLPPAAEWAAELRAAHGRATALPGWPESLDRAVCEVVDHAGEFGLAGLGHRAQTASVVREFVDGGVVAGRLVAAAGPDLHLVVAAGPDLHLVAAAGPDPAPGTGRGLILDTRLLAGWRLEAAAGETAAGGVTVPVAELGGVQGGLF